MNSGTTRVGGLGSWTVGQGSLPIWYCLRMPISIEYVFPILAVPINTNIYSNTCCSGTRTRLLKAASPSSSRRNVLKEAQNINKSYRLLVKIAQNCSKMRKFAQILSKMAKQSSEVPVLQAQQINIYSNTCCSCFQYHNTNTC